MRLRHKPPSLVSMWMLDVFCCALGCVTLLWLLNTKEAGEQTRRAGSALELLRQAESDLKARQAELIATRADFDQTRRKLNADIEDLQARLLAITDERDAAEKKLALTRAEVTDTQTKLTAATTRSKELDELLAKKQKEAKDLAARVATVTMSADELSRLLRQREKERDDVALKAKKAEDQINDLDARLKSVAKEREDAKSDLAALKKTGDELSTAQKTIRDLQKKADDANAMIIDLQGDKAKLADRYNKLQAESESRFAGIAMTGKRVVFVVDMSGSMKLLDDKTPAPTKWATVVETIAKVMRSLPELERYQVILFSRKAEPLFGQMGWLPYEGEASVRKVREALSRVEPVGDTNLFDAMEMAFRLRAAGLDTIYLFSDGLPTSGPGVTPDEEKKLTESARSERLSRHLRQTLQGTWNRGSDGPRVKINSVGFFFESPEVGAFLWALSRENDGSFVGMSRP